tara:strand:+ start:562 stop:1317 length:756 start_codon:yes stop_codon:yes gene_type:complete
MSEIKQLFTPQADSSSQAADLIHISRTFPPDLKAAFADKIEHFSEYEFGYYAELSSTKNVIEFKNKILSIVQGLGFSDFAFMRVHCGDIDSRLLLTTPADLLASYFGDDFMKYDMMLPYAEQKLDPVYCSEVFAYAADSPFQNETTRAMKAIFELNKSYGFHDFYNIPMKARNGEGNVLFSVTVRGHSPTDVKRIVDECHMALTLLCEAIDDRLNHTRVCESRMELTPVIQLIEIAKEGVSGNYKDLKKAI